jgi:dolichol-phosphate mannosyltransferase
VRARLRVVEVPITFVERTLGSSKMSGSIVLEAMARVTVWGLTGRGARHSNPMSTATADRDS